MFGSISHISLCLEFKEDYVANVVLKVALQVLTTKYHEDVSLKSIFIFNTHT